MPRPAPTIGFLALAIAVLAGCGTDDRRAAGDVPTAGDGPTTVTVSIEDFAFGPPSLTVAAGSTIRFENRDAQAHTATAKQDAFDTDRVDPGQAVEVTVTEPGEIAYFCAFHPFMEGTVVVA